MSRTRPAPIDAAFAASLVVAGCLTVAHMVRTSTASADPFDSSMFWWSWLLYPGLAGAATWARHEGPRPVLWSAAAVGPLALYVAYAGTAGHDPDEGASLWLVGEVFIAVQAGLALVIATLVQAHKQSRATRFR